jgi:transcriptional regulator with XRE-family HTH domain
MKILRELRLNSKMSQVQLGKLLGVTGSQVGMLEQGKREPSIKTLIKLSDIFKVPIDLLVREDDNKAERLLNDYYNDNCFPYTNEEQCLLEFCKELLIDHPLILKKLTYMSYIEVQEKVIVFKDKRKINLTKAKRDLFSATIEAIIDNGEV